MSITVNAPPTDIRDLPRPVTMNYRNSESTGNVTREIGYRETGSQGDYYHVLQLIEYDDCDHPTHIRAGYYLRKENEDTWRWMTQTAFHVPIPRFMEMFGTLLRSASVWRNW